MNIYKLASFITDGLFTTTGNRDYDVQLRALDVLCTGLKSTDEIDWDHGSESNCSLSDLIVGSYQYFRDNYDGQTSDEYRVLCRLGEIYKPGNSDDDSETVVVALWGIMFQTTRDPYLKMRSIVCRFDNPKDNIETQINGTRREIVEHYSDSAFAYHSENAERGPIRQIDFLIDGGDYRIVEQMNNIEIEYGEGDGFDEKHYPFKPKHHGALLKAYRILRFRGIAKFTYHATIHGRLFLIDLGGDIRLSVDDLKALADVPGLRYFEIRDTRTLQIALEH